MSKKLNELRQQYNEAVKGMRALHEKAEKEDRSLSADEQVSWNNMRSGLDALKLRIEREEELAGEELRAAAPVPPGREGTLDDPDASAAMGRRGAGADDPHSLAFRSYLRGGVEQMSDAERRLMAESRDLSLTGASGGFTVPQGFYNSLLETQRLWGGFLDPNVVTELETDGGNPIPVPLEDDTANAAAIVAEGAALTTSADATFAQLTLGAFTYRSLVRVSLELLQDSAFNLEEYIRRKLAIRLWRGFNVHASTGTNSGQPQGLFNATVGAGVGHTAATGNTTTFPYISLVALEHSVDPLYRRSPRARWMFSDALLQAIKSQLDSSGRPIWQPNYAGMGDASSPYMQFGGTILGYQYVINPDAPVPAANARCAAFGDFAFYLVRRVRNLMMIRADQRFIDQGQIGFYLFARMDGKFGNPTAVAARSPIRLGQNSAT